MEPQCDNPIFYTSPERPSSAENSFSHSSGFPVALTAGSSPVSLNSGCHLVVTEVLGSKVGQCCKYSVHLEPKQYSQHVENQVRFVK